jgi:tetratricopeptide (TPR) repeat protein
MAPPAFSQVVTGKPAAGVDPGAGWITPPPPKLASSDRPVHLPAGLTALNGPVPEPVSAWLVQWQKAELADEPITPERIAALATLLDDHKSPALLWAQCADLLAFMDGFSVTRSLCSKAIEHAIAETGDGHVPSHSLAESLWPLHDLLWNQQKFDEDLKLLDLLRPAETRGTGHSLWASYTRAQVLEKLGRYEQAFHAYQDLVAERADATEPSDGTNRSLVWELAGSAFMSGHYDEALKYDEVAAGQHNAYAEPASAGACITLACLGREDQAMARLKEHIAHFHPTPAQVTEIIQEIRRESDKAKSRASDIAPNSAAGGVRP